MLDKLLIALAILNTLDWITTRVFLATGAGVEANPVAESLLESGSFDYVKLLMNFLLLAGVGGYSYSRRYVEEVVFSPLYAIVLALIAFYACVVVNNILIIMSSG